MPAAALLKLSLQRRTSSERLMYIQFASCVQGDIGEQRRDGAS